MINYPDSIAYAQKLILTIFYSLNWNLWIDCYMHSNVQLEESFWQLQNIDPIIRFFWLKNKTKPNQPINQQTSDVRNLVLNRNAFWILVKPQVYRCVSHVVNHFSPLMYSPLPNTSSVRDSCMNSESLNNYSLYVFPCSSAENFPYLRFWPFTASNMS